MSMNPQRDAATLLAMTRQSPEEKLNRLLNAWNSGDLKLNSNITRNDAEQLAALAYQHGKNFETRSKPGKEFMFNLANTASFGLLPDKYFKPERVGEMYHGKPAIDSFLGGAGSLLGLVGAGYGVLKGGTAAAQGVTGLAAGGLGYAKQGLSGVASQIASLPPKLRSEFIKRFYYSGKNPGGGFGGSGTSLFDLARPGGGFTGSPLGL